MQSIELIGLRGLRVLEALTTNNRLLSESIPPLDRIEGLSPEPSAKIPKPETRHPGKGSRSRNPKAAKGSTELNSNAYFG